MRLYLSRGRIWTGTQADAKAAQGGPTYETVEVPDAKPERLAWLNAQWARLMGDKPEPEPAPPPAPVNAMPEAPEGHHWRIVPDHSFGPRTLDGKIVSRWEPGTDDCLSCHRKRVGAQIMGEIMAKGQIADAIAQLTIEHHLADIEEMIRERRAEINAVTGVRPEMLPVPRARVRVRVPVGEVEGVKAVYVEGREVTA